MKKTLVTTIAILAISAPAFGALVNGGWSTGDETGWTRWRAPWGATENWTVTSSGPNAPEGTLSSFGGNGSFGWFQVVTVPAGTPATLTADWAGNTGATGWAEIMLFSSANDLSDADWTVRIDTGNAADVAFKKDSWGMNPPTAWGWQAASLSPHPSGNGGTIISQGYVCVALKLGGFPIGTASFDNIVLTAVPEPSTVVAGVLLLLPLGARLLRKSKS